MKERSKEAQILYMVGDYLSLNMLFVKAIGRIINFMEKDWL